MESHYSVKADAEHRAIAGLSMGGGIADHVEATWIPSSRRRLLVGHLRTAEQSRSQGRCEKKLRLLWVSCGDIDYQLINANKSFHNALEENKVPHIWHVDSGAITWPVWKNDLYLLRPLLFRDK